VLALDGNYANCSVVTLATTGIATVTVYGNTSPGLYGLGGPSLANTNFGANGVITATTTQSVTSGNVANLPVGLYFTWAGNTGTLHAWATCSSAIRCGRRTIGLQGQRSRAQVRSSVGARAAARSAANG
jgi:hypothetical protein